MKGESYTGPAVLFGRNYMTHYEPVKRETGLREYTSSASISLRASKT
jgi:hypothetical protein